VKAGGGHGKGASFERKIAKSIVKALKQFGVKQRDCWRSVMSGGHAMSSGDLEMSVRMEKLFPYSVECKHHRKIEWWRFLIPVGQRRKSWKEVRWLQQTLDGCKKRDGLRPLLVMKENNRPIIVMLLQSYPTKWHAMLWTEFLKKSVLYVKNNKLDRR
jgi:hypothetical protein